MSHAEAMNSARGIPHPHITSLHRISQGGAISVASLKPLVFTTGGLNLNLINFFLMVMAVDGVVDARFVHMQRMRYAT